MNCADWKREHGWNLQPVIGAAGSASGSAGCDLIAGRASASRSSST